jgi:hypothetical protein
MIGPQMPARAPIARRLPLTQGRHSKKECGMSHIVRVVHTAKTGTTGGREYGASRSSDGLLDISLSIPGSARIGTNPEQLFAASIARFRCDGIAVAPLRTEPVVRDFNRAGGSGVLQTSQKWPDIAGSKCRGLQNQVRYFKGLSAETVVLPLHHYQNDYQANSIGYEIVRQLSASVPLNDRRSLRGDLLLASDRSW